MRRTFKVVTTLAGLIFTCQALAAEIVWSTSGFKMPESAEYDVAHDRYYVSNVNGGVMEQDGNGSISLLDGNGKLIDVDWITGLHSPKGLALYKNKLYVADVKQLVVINVDSGKIVARYEASDSRVLNGIATNQDGKVFVSDWTGNCIYTLEDGELKIWLEDPELNSPNGLWADKTHLYVASWGRNPKEDFTTETSGNLKKISLKTQQIETLDHEGQWLNLDGIARYARDKWLVSDFLKGELLLINKSGHIEKSLPLKKSSADFYYLPEKQLVIVPLLMENQVVAYRVD